MIDREFERSHRENLKIIEKALYYRYDLERERVRRRKLGKVNNIEYCLIKCKEGMGQ